VETKDEFVSGCRQRNAVSGMTIPIDIQIWLQVGIHSNLIEALSETTSDTQRSQTSKLAGDSQLESQDRRLWNCQIVVFCRSRRHQVTVVREYISGILTLVDREKTSLVSMKMTTQKGTLAYMAPEIYQSSSYGPEGR